MRDDDRKPPSAGGAFVKGGCGCLIAFAVIALLAVMFGGSAYIDLGGAILLFVIGGLIGLVVFAIYSRGRRDSEPRRRQGRRIDD